jgi:uncharacterized protein YndB with AHSA1/START domain
MEKQIAEESILIHADRAEVWKVLTTPEFIREWDGLPPNFGDAPLKNGVEIIWKIDAAKFTRLTVIGFEPGRQLKQSLYVSTWEEIPAPEDITYTYTLTDEGENTRLTITIGDFSFISNGESYYEASVEFAETAASRIKELAEA